MKETAARLLRGNHSLEFFNGQILYRASNEVGESYKFLSLGAVIAAFRDAPIDSGWIPPGVIRCGGTATGDFAVLVVPAGIHQLSVQAMRGARYHDFRVPLPAFAFFGKGKRFKVWALKESEPSPNALLFRAPLPNVFGDGGICWGTNSPPRASAATIRQAWELFITSGFNDHAAGDKSRSHKADVRGLLHSLKGKRVFPLADLVSTARTFDFQVKAEISAGGSDV